MDVVSLTQKLIRIEGLSGKEGAMADAVEETMRALGYRDVTRDSYGTVVGRVGPPGNRTSILFDGHMDVVPITGDWTVDPFGGVIKGDRLFGRGATDMKGGLSAAICGVAAAAKNGKLRREVAVSASVMEEVIEGVALGAVIDVLNPETVVICEPSDLKIQVGQRGRAEILMKVAGIPSHAAHPERGKNPIDLAAKGLAALAGMNLPEQEEFGRGILVPTDVITDPYPSISLIPSSLTVRFDRRTLPGETEDQILNDMQAVLDEVDPEAFGLSLTANPLNTYTNREMDQVRYFPAWALPRDHTLARAAETAMMRSSGGARFGVYGFCTNGSESMGRRGIPTIGLGPGKEEDAHTADESVGLEELRAAQAAYERITLELAGDGGQ